MKNGCNEMCLPYKAEKSGQWVYTKIGSPIQHKTPCKNAATPILQPLNLAQGVCALACGGLLRIRKYSFPCPGISPCWASRCTCICNSFIMGTSPRGPGLEDRGTEGGRDVGVCYCYLSMRLIYGIIHSDWWKVCRIKLQGCNSVQPPLEEGNKHHDQPLPPPTHTPQNKPASSSLVAVHGCISPGKSRVQPAHR